MGKSKILRTYPVWFNIPKTDVTQASAENATLQHKPHLCRHAHKNHPSATAINIKTPSAVTELPLCANTLTLFTDSQTESAECVRLCPQHDQTPSCSPSFTSPGNVAGPWPFHILFFVFMCTQPPLSVHSAEVKLKECKESRDACLAGTHFFFFVFSLSPRSPPLLSSVWVPLPQCWHKQPIEKVL